MRQNSFVEKFCLNRDKSRNWDPKSLQFLFLRELLHKILGRSWPKIQFQVFFAEFPRLFLVLQLILHKKQPRNIFKNGKTSFFRFSSTISSAKDAPKPEIAEKRWTETVKTLIFQIFSTISSAKDSQKPEIAEKISSKTVKTLLFRFPSTISSAKDTPKPEIVEENSPETMKTLLSRFSRRFL